MTFGEDQYLELEEQFTLYTKGKLSEIEQKELFNTLNQSPELLELFTDHLMLIAQLEYEFFSISEIDATVPEGHELKHNANVDATAVSISPISNSPTLGFLSPKGFLRTKYRNFLQKLQEPLGLSIMLAMLSISSLLVTLALIYPDFYDSISNNSSSIAKNESTTTATIIDIEGELVANNKPLQRRSRLAIEKTYTIEEGVVEIQFDKKATVLVNGPASFEVKSDNAIKLNYGSLFAEVPKTAIGFTAHSSSVVVKDLSTEFSMKVDRSGASTVQVHMGEVEASTNNFNKKNIYRIHAGYAMYFDSSGSIQKASNVTFDPFLSPQRISDYSTRNLNLADVVAGGDGFGQRANRGIHQSSGELVLDLKSNFKNKGNNKYHPVEELPYVDGVFVPDGGNGAFKVDSKGHLVTGIPDTNNSSYGFIWSGGVPNPSSSTPATISTEYARVKLPREAIGMHANKGITFDLNAMRKDLDQWQISSFSTFIGMADNQGGKFDVWVVVDGKIRKKLQEITKSSQIVILKVKLNPEDEFLTLMTTDSTVSTGADWAVWQGPKLRLTRKK